MSEGLFAGVVGKWRTALARREGYLPIDGYWAEFCIEGETCADEAPGLFLLFATVSRALREGNPCVLLSELANMKLPGEVLADAAPGEEESTEVSPSLDSFRFPRRARLVEWMAKCEAVSCFALSDDTELEPGTPLVFDGDDRLYLCRFYQHERNLARHLARLLASETPTAGGDWLQTRLDHYFGAADPEFPDLQRAAAEAALAQRLCVVSGGPGTGKTSTVVKILALLAEMAQVQQLAPPRILLMAPTGKAAARLNESILAALERLELDPSILEAIQPRATTIHRALGVRPDSATRFVRHAEYPLSCEVVLIDEGSMVDLSLMRSVCDALPSSARLIVLGDRHQLASVEAGSVFSELCFALGEQESPSLTELKKSYRFSEGSGISALANAIREGDHLAVSAFRENTHPDVRFRSSIEHSVALVDLFHLALEHFRPAFRSSDPEAALRAFGRFRILAAHRRGPFGVEQLNAQLAQFLVENGMLPHATQLSRGQLLMVLENDPALRLSNGDIAVIWPDERGRLMACFPTAQQEGLRRISPAQLPPYELCYVMTVHKSQGSEYDSVALVLPQAGSPILSRELLYTGVTRSKTQIEVFADDASLKQAVGSKVIRCSGLALALGARTERGSRASRQP